MDQTPYNPQLISNKTLHKKGTKTVPISQMKSNINHLVVCLAVCGDGTKIPPLIVFKVKLGGSIEKQIQNFPPCCKYVVQENAWKDERVMLYWVNNVLKPCVQNCPPESFYICC